MTATFDMWWPLSIGLSVYCHIADERDRRSSSILDFVLICVSGWHVPTHREQGCEL